MDPSLAAFSAPRLALFGTEPLRALLELTGARLMPWRGRAADRGDDHPVVLFPGLASDGAAVAPLQRLCQSLGSPATDWGRGLNTGPSGDVNAWIARLGDEV